MNINEEKAFVYSMMREITEERRRLTDIYYELKKRLDSLDILEHRGIDELSLKGIIDLHNSKNTALAIANIQRESEMAIKRVEQELTPKVEAIIPRVEIELEKEKVQAKAKSISKKSGTVSYDKVSSLVVTILKEAGRPLKTNDIFIEVNKRYDVEVSKKNFSNNIMYRIAKENKKVSRATFGYYQYAM